MGVPKYARELIEEIKATPGFTVDEFTSNGGHRAKVFGPTGSTTLSFGHTGGHDDRNLRQQLRKYVSWPPTAVGAALNEATARRVSGEPRPALSLALPPNPAPKPAAAPVVRPTTSPAAVPAASTPGYGTAAVRWTQAVYRYLREHPDEELTFDELVHAVPPRECGLAMGSVSPIMSARWLEAQRGDVFLHIYRRRIQRGFAYRWQSNQRAPERPDQAKLGVEPPKPIEPKPVVPEPAPPTPLVIPDPEPVKPTVPEPSKPTPFAEPTPWIPTDDVTDWVTAASRRAVLPDVFERVGAIDGDLLLRDENGDVWRARKGVL